MADEVRNSADESIDDQSRPVAVVTGGASGIGFALAKRLGATGYFVVIGDRNAEELAEAVHELTAAGFEVVGIECDVADAASMSRLAAEISQRRGRVDLVCANAGVSGPPSGLVWTSSLVDWNRVYAVNVFGLVNTLTAFLPTMISAGRGEILVTGSLTSFISEANATIYMSSKHAVHAIADSTRQQLDALDIPIRIHLVCPGGVMTRIMQHELAEAERLHGVAEPTAPLIQRSNDSGEVLDADTVAETALEAVGTDNFYVFTHSDSRSRVMRSLDPLLEALPELPR